MGIGTRLRDARKAAGLTMAQLGAAVGLSAAAISRYELEQREPALDILSRIADILGVSVSYLMGQDPVDPLDDPEHDTLDEITVAFHGGYVELTEENKRILRDMARIMLKSQGGGDSRPAAADSDET